VGSREDEINRYLKKLNEIRDALIALRHFQEKTIQSLSYYNRAIDVDLANIEFMFGLYDNLDQQAIDSIPESEYSSFIRPLSDLTYSGAIFITLDNETKSVQDYVDRFSPIASSTSATFVTSTGDSVATFFGSTYCIPSERERLRNLLLRYLQRLRLEDEITYIRSRLSKLIPDILEDFEHFISNYNATNKNEQKYQELIGYRSTLYLKLIDGFVERHGLVKNTSRRQRIMVFVYGQSTSADKSLNKLADAAVAFWHELSNQDASKMSAKMGNITSEYAQILYANSIIISSSLLKENEKSWR